MDDTNMTDNNNLLDEYVLSTQLLSDGEPVRCVTVHDGLSSSKPSASGSIPASSLELLSGSQGGVVSRFILANHGSKDGTDDSNNAEPQLEIQPGGADTRHPHQITAILSSATLPPFSPKVASSIYVTGCKDGNIRVMDGVTHGLKCVLEGHSNAVTSLSWVCPENSSDDNGANGRPWLVSGSWDGTAKIWDVFDSSSGSCLATLAGHENTVNVAGLPAESSSVRKLVTVSAGIAEGNVIRGHTVRIWKLNVSSTSVTSTIVAQVANDHSEPMRDVCYDPQTHCIYTCSNDGTVKVRSPEDGKCTTTLAYPGDRPMLLSVCVVGDWTNKAVVAGAEDGHVVVWRIHSNGNDGVQVIAHPGCVWKVSPISPDSTDFLTACNDGHIRRFTRHPALTAPPAVISSFNDSVTEAKSARSSGPTPEEIANLPKWEMNALTQGRSEGQVQVFNKDGKAIAAQWSATSRTWIEVGEVTGTNANAGTLNGKRYDHVLPIEIDVPGGGVQKLQIGYNNGENPFVVAQAFIDEHMLDQGYLAQIADYIRQRAGDSGPTIGGSGGGGASGAGGGVTPSYGAPSSVPMPMDTTPTYNHLPMKGYKIFDSGIDKKGLAKVVQKLREFNDTLSSSNNPNALTSEESGPLLDSLSQTLATTNRYHSSTVSNEELSILSKIISSWDASHAFPALDLARMAALHPDATKGVRRAYWEKVLGGALSLCLGLGDKAAGEVAVPMLTMRLLSNSFKGGAGSAGAAGSLADRILDCAEACAPSNNKNVRLSVATALLNTSSYLHSTPPSSSAAAVRVLDVLGIIGGCGKYESEPIVRALTALGTVLLIPGSVGIDVKKVAKDRSVGSMVERVASGHGDLAQSLTTEILSVLHS